MNFSAPVADISFHAAIEAESGGHELKTKVYFGSAKNAGYVELKQEGEGELTVYMLRGQMEDLHRKLGAVLYPPEEAHCATCGAEALPEKEPSDAV